MLILGVNAFHGDSAACVVRDGELIAAVEEERFRRVKHWAGLPTEAIRSCLNTCEVRLRDIDHLAINRQPGANSLRRALFVLRHRPQPGLILDRLRNIWAAHSIEFALRDAFPRESMKARVHHVEHHVAHLASAFFVSPFDEAVCLSLDGFGDFASAAWGPGRKGDLTVEGRIYFPHSLGIFYSAITQFLGFPHFGDEYKVMGLAPYGTPRYLKEMRELVRVAEDGTYSLNLCFFRHHLAKLAESWNGCAPKFEAVFTPSLESLLGAVRKESEPLTQVHKDIAASAQAMYEEAFFALLNALWTKYRCPHLALAGGCAMNSVANGKVYLRTPFKQLYLPPAAGDAGGAIGAAFEVWRTMRREENPHREPSHGGVASGIGPVERETPKFVFSNPFMGPRFDENRVARLLVEKGEDLLGANCAWEQMRDEKSLCQRTAEELSAGKVIGWFQGRMEWGPRALGNRSILCDPRRADMKHTLNARIKRRESFRPFAPSILREYVREWFEQEDDVPFMNQVFQVRASKRELVPAITHVDGSGRLQTVHRDSNLLYWRLISEFFRLTSVPLILNTSFNENEPVVCEPGDALSCFLRTDLDLLVLGRWIIRRKRA